MHRTHIDLSIYWQLVNPYPIQYPVDTCPPPLCLHETEPRESGPKTQIGADAKAAEAGSQGKRWRQSDAKARALFLK